MNKFTDIAPGPTASSGPDQRQYLALRDRFALQIERGGLLPGAKFPSERALQFETGLARGTIREALFQLEAEGLIYRRDRSGWYVSPPPVVYDPTRWVSFLTYVAEQGRTPSTETLDVTLEPMGEAAAAVFGDKPSSLVYVLRRRRSIDGRPVLVERILVHPDVAPGLSEHDLDSSLTALLQDRYGVTMARTRVEMQPCALVREEASLLGAKSGSPGLLVLRTCFDAKGRVVEYDEEHWRHDTVRILVDTRPVPPAEG
jgi:DNA-binding GntR family transcriptional regulator